MSGEAILPPEIITDILIRCDVKSLLVLQCVCKLWSSIIKSRHFIRMHSRQAETTGMVEERLYEDGDRKNFTFTHIRNGLLLEQHNKKNKFRIRNPATKAKVDLPCPLHKPKFTGFVYLPSSENYKVVNVFGKNGFGGCQVLTLGIDFLWRNLKIPQLNCLKDSQLDQELCLCTNELTFIMWFSDVSEEHTARDIVCIEMETESFETVTAPEALFPSWEGVLPMRWDDKFLLYCITVREELHVWMLEDYKNKKWADSEIIISLSFLSKHPNISADKFCRVYFTKEWLYFCDDGGNNGIWYSVKSGSYKIRDEAQTKYAVKFSLRNPSTSIPVDY